MDAIELKKSDLDKLPLISDNTYESKIYRCGFSVYKIFRVNTDIDGIRYDDAVLRNKQAKINLLHDLDLDERFILPKKEIYVDGVFKGYSMDYINGNDLFDQSFYLKRTKIRLLKMIRSIILEAHKNGIILCDINLGNFIYNNPQLYICDLDNSRIGGFNEDTYCKMLLRDYLTYHNFDENSDFYIFNIICLQMLSGIKLSDIMRFTFENTKDGCEIKEKFLNFENHDYDPAKFDIIDYCEDNNVRKILRKVYNGEKF